MAKSRAPQYAIGAAAQLGPLARAMGYLVSTTFEVSCPLTKSRAQMENSIAMCYGYLKDIATGGGADDSSSKKAIRKMEGFANLMKELEKQAARGFSMHPKMDTLRTLLIDHFGKELPDPADASGVCKSRAMVFVSFRECVEEIVELLNKESPIIRAKAFIGQGTDKQGKKGYAQKEQLEVSGLLWSYVAVYMPTCGHSVGYRTIQGRQVQSSSLYFDRRRRIGHRRGRRDRLLRRAEDPHPHGELRLSLRRVFMV